MNPKVTIIIPTYNRKNFLTDAIKSALSQTSVLFEILILDDASTDNTHETILPFLEDMRVRYIKHPENIGITANRNYGLSIAEGEYIAMLDSDDVWLDSCKLQRQVDILATHGNIALVGTYANIINRNGDVVGKIKTHGADSSIRKNLMFENQFIQSSVLIRKSVFEQVGQYDQSIPIWEDYELWLRIGERYELRNIPEFLTAYREHENNISKVSEEKSIQAYGIIYKLYKNKYPWSVLLFFKIIIKRFLINLKHFS